MTCLFTQAPLDSCGVGLALGPPWWCGSLSRWVGVRFLNSPYEIRPWDFKMGTWDNHGLVLIQVVVYSLGATWVVLGDTWYHPTTLFGATLNIAKRSHYLYISRNI